MEPIQETKPSPEQMPPVFRGGVEPRLTFKEAIGECLGKYATFTGRSRRSEYWWFGLFVLILTLIPTGLAIATEGILGKTENAFCIVLLMGVASFGVVLWTIIPSLTVQTRRLHDVGRSGWWIVGGVAVGLLYPIAKSVVLGFEALYSDNEVQNLIDAFHVSTLGGTVMLLLAMVGLGLSIAVFVFSLQDSHRGENKYGPSPKYP